MSNLEPVKSEIVEKKRAAWANLGESIYNQELQLQARAQEAINSISIPTKPEDLQQAEADLKMLSKAEKEITEDRKKITSRFDEVTSRLMIPEKSFAAPKKALTDATILVKKEVERKQKIEAQRESDKKLLKQSIENQITEFEKNLRIEMSDLVTKAYAYALGDGSISLEDLADYLNKVKARVTYEKCVPKYDIPKFDSLTIDDYKMCDAEILVSDPAELVKEFHQAIVERFQDYEVALKNKADAIKIAEKEKAEKEAEINEQAENKNIATSFEAQAIDFSTKVEPVTKALKKAYEIDMEETYENAMIIMRAFLANLNACKDKTTTKKWFSFDANSAGKALAKLKGEDNHFAPQGVIFKEVDKL